MNKACRRYKAVSNGANVRHMKSCASLRHGDIDRQNAAGEGRHNMAIQPSAKYRAQARVASLNEQHASL